MAEPIDKDTRGPVNLRIKFRSESLQQFIERYGVDVSRGGIFIRTREPLPVGTRLRLDFQLVDTAPLFQGDGTVVWIREHDASRAGVTPGMGVRFDRLTPESQTTLDTILEEKIRLQQSGVAPGSVAKAGAGIAVRRVSGAFAALEPTSGQGAKPPGPPPLPVEVKLDTPKAPPLGAAPATTMPLSSSRSGPMAATGSSSIFTRPRTTSGMRALPGPSALFEPPTAADIDKALSALEEKGGGPPSLPAVPTVVHRSDSRAFGDDDPTKVFDGSVAEEFAAHEAITGPAALVPETGVPVASDGGDGDLTERRSVDPASGEIRPGALTDGKAAGKRSEMPPPIPGGTGKTPPPAPLDAPLASLVDSGNAPAAKPPAAPAMKLAAAAPSSQAVPKKITTDRPAATESGRFRSDTRYKRKRGKGAYWAVAVLLIGGGVAGSGLYVKRERDRRAAEAMAAAAASPPLNPAQLVVPPMPPVPPTAPGTGGAGATPAETAGTVAEAPDKAVAKPEEAVAKADKADKQDKQDVGKPGDKTAGASTEKSAQEGQASAKSGAGGSRKKDRGSSAPKVTAAIPAEKSAEATGDKKPAGEEAKSAGETAKTDTKTDTTKSADTAKAAAGEKDEKVDKVDKTDKTGGDAPKPAEAAAAPAPSAPPVLKITSSPAGAQVVIDGVPVGTTPFSSKDITADATHAISVKKDGYETHERMISGSDWSRGRGGVQSLKFSVKLKRAGGEAKPAGESGEKKEGKPPEVEILTPSEP